MFENITEETAKNETNINTYSKVKARTGCNFCDAKSNFSVKQTYIRTISRHFYANNETSSNNQSKLATSILEIMK
jgi:hypothetical protein